MAQEAPKDVKAKKAKSETKTPAEPKKPVRARSAPPTPPPTLADEYAHDDSGFDPDIDVLEGEHAGAPRATPQSPAPGTAQAPASRDPETGRFLPTTEKPAHPPRLARLAAHFGFSGNEIDSLSTDELEARVEAVQEQILREHANNRFQQDTRQAIAPKHDPDNRPLIGEPDDHPANQFQLFEDEESIHPDIVNGSKALHNLIQAQDKRIKALEDLVGDLSKREAVRLNETRVQTIDRVFSSLKDHMDMFGEGAGSDLREKNPEALKRRLKMLELAEREVREKKTPLEKAIREIVTTLYPRTASKSEPAPTNGRISAEEWNAAGLGLPTHRDAEEPKGERRAMKAVARKQREMGIDPEGEFGHEEAGLPD